MLPALSLYHRRFTQEMSIRPVFMCVSVITGHYVVDRFISSALSSDVWTRQLVKADVVFVITMSYSVHTTGAGFLSRYVLWCISCRVRLLFNYVCCNSSLDWIGFCFTGPISLCLDSFLWPPYVIGGALYFCPVVSFLLSSFYLFFPRLISAAVDRMSAILLHMAWP